MAILGLALFLVTLNARPLYGEDAANIILLIGDGMGPEQVKAAECFKGGPLFFQSWANKSRVDTASANSEVTDSAAAATAMATGRRVNNGVISIAIPGDSSELQTALEYFKGKGKLTGLVTSDAMTGATPAAFGAHESSRGGQAGIAGDYLSQTRPNILFGGGKNGMTVEATSAAGYLVVTNRAGMLGLNTGSITNVSAQFGDGPLPYEYDGAADYPHLSQMTSNALAILQKGRSGFFLLVEGGNIDHACHGHDLPRMIPDVIEFEQTVQTVMDWAKKRSDTLVLVTADHETGGLKVVKNNGAGRDPTVEWTANGHTATNVCLWAWGVNSDKITPQMANTNIFQLMVRQ
jgi:alkaline phosphatase